MLLSQTQNLESLEIRECLSSLLLATLLGPRTLLPFRLDTGLFPLRLDYASSCTSGELLENQRGEDDVGKSDRLTGDGSLGVC